MIRTAGIVFISKGVSDKSHQLVEEIRRKRESRIQFQKRSQQFIRADDETFSVAAMCVNNPTSR